MVNISKLKKKLFFFTWSNFQKKIEEYELKGVLLPKTIHFTLLEKVDTSIKVLSKRIVQ